MQNGRITFVGVAPSVALLRHFFSLQMVDSEQRSGCVSLRAADATVGMIIDVELHPDVGGFWRQWVYVDAAAYGPLLLIPTAPVEPSSSWGHVKLIDPRLARVMTRLAVMPPIQSYTNHARKRVRSRSGTHAKLSQHNSTINRHTSIILQARGLEGSNTNARS